MTHATGAPVGDTVNIQTAGPHGSPSYWPNSKGIWTDQPQLNEPPLEINGAVAHWAHRVDEDHHQQPGDLFRKMNAAQRQTLFDNTARAMGDARNEVKQRHIDNCAKANAAYDAGVAASVACLAAGAL